MKRILGTESLSSMVVTMTESSRGFHIMMGSIMVDTGEKEKSYIELVSQRVGKASLTLL